MSERLVPSERRKRNAIEVQLPTGLTVLCRRRDMTAILFEGRVPMPMLTAVEKMIEMPNASPAQRLQALATEGKPLLDLLRMHACQVTIDPKLTLEETTNDHELCVDELDTAELMAIWSATAVVPQVGAAAAAEFRPAASPDDVAAAPAGADVPAPAEQLDSQPEREIVSR